MRQAKVKESCRWLNLTAHSGREYVKHEWRPAPDDGEDNDFLEYRDTAVIEEAEPEPAAEDTAVSDEPSLTVDLEEMTVAELKDMARDAGIEGFSTMRKAELIEALKDD